MLGEAGPSVEAPKWALSQPAFAKGVGAGAPTYKTADRPGALTCGALIIKEGLLCT